jgi:hypothetical protein
MLRSVRLPLSAAVLMASVVASAAGPYCATTADGIQRLPRSASACPTGYFGSGDCCVAFHRTTPAAYPKIDGAACPTGTFRSGGACVRFR